MCDSFYLSECPNCHGFKVKVGGVDVEGSPCPISVVPGPPDPGKCLPFFGRFAKSSVAGNATLEGFSGEGFSFTVSMYDLFGNKCTEGAVVASIRPIDNDPFMPNRQV